ncbi:MAG: M12 family metallo-peptidase [Phycisphaerae bacterium]|nr:M12 family metallo-peptidase [Phycisphaerae bacterium]
MPLTSRCFSPIQASPFQPGPRFRIVLCSAALSFSVAMPSGAASAGTSEVAGLQPVLVDQSATSRARADDSAPTTAPEPDRRESAFEAATIERLRIGDVLALPTASGDRAAWVRMRVESISAGRPGTLIVKFAGEAELLSDPFASATLVLRDGLVGGFIRPRDGFELALAAIGPGRQEIRLKAESTGDCCGIDHDDVKIPEPLGGVAADCGESPKVVDVAFIYTPNAATFWGGDAAIQLQLEAAVSDTNSALKNSKLVTRLRLVHIEAATNIFLDSPAFQVGTLPEILNAMSSGVGGNAAQQAWYTLAHAVRNSFGADLCQGVADVSNVTLCGVADQFDGNPEKAFSAVSAECLGDFVPAHQFGHGFGACHAAGDGGGCDFGGYYPFSNGWRFFGVSGQLWRTVMAAAPGVRIPFFSTPFATFDGMAVGVPGSTSASADNARTIGLTALSVANFRCTVDILDDCNGNGEADALDLLDGTSQDCNGNGIPDECDIASGFLSDLNLNGIPDPCEAGTEKIVAPDLLGQPVILDVFGFSLSVGRRLDQAVDASAFLVSGAYGDDDFAVNSGAAYVIPIVGANPGTPVKLKASDAALNTNANFGRAVAGLKRIAQSTPAATPRLFAAIGAYRAPNGTIAQQGAVYVFAQDPAQSWTQRLKLKASDGAANDWFGFSVGMTRIGADNFETLVVGAPKASTNKGAVYVYRYQLADTTSLSKKLVIPFGGDGDQFGWSVAVDNNIGDRAILLAGAPGYGENIGRVRAYERSLAANANFSSSGATIVLDPSETQVDDRFGEAVAVDGEAGALGAAAIIGAPGKNSGRGAIYYFERTSPNVWTQRQKITLPSPAIDDRFGAAVSLWRRSDGALILLAAAPRGDGVTPAGLQTNLGLIGVYKFNPMTNLFDVIGVGTTYDAQTGDQAGTSIVQLQPFAGTGTLSAIGMPFDDDGGLDAGSVVVAPLVLP